CGAEEALLRSILEDYGNIVSASIPVARFEAIQQKKVQRGHKILL
ncbi:3-oxoacyl-[acyl-carrier-protein] synthase III C-terminal domain-containing protein, partial [Bacillus sp. S2-R3J1-FB-BA1]